MGNLKPCPFCGGEADLVTGTYRDGGYLENTAYVQCEDCGMRTYEFHECETAEVVQGFAADVWNMRTERACRMIHDAERCEVAKKLRGLNGNISHVRRVYEAEGLSIFCNDQADYYQICDAVAGYLPAEHMHPCDYDEIHACLADLIEPDQDHNADPDKKVDRDALLAIAGEMEVTGREYRYMVDENFVTSDLIDDAPEDFVEYARRIRKACGEEGR